MIILHILASSDVVPEDKVLVSRRLKDKNQSLGLSLALGLETKSLRSLKTFAPIINDQSILNF